jgi:hypothetical protein
MVHDLDIALGYEMTQVYSARHGGAALQGQQRHGKGRHWNPAQKPHHATTFPCGVAFSSVFRR